MAALDLPFVSACPCSPLISGSKLGEENGDKKFDVFQLLVNLAGGNLAAADLWSRTRSCSPIPLLRGDIDPEAGRLQVELLNVKQKLCEARERAARAEAALSQQVPPLSLPHTTLHCTFSFSSSVQKGGELFSCVYVTYFRAH